MSKAIETVKHLFPVSVLTKRQTKEVVKHGVKIGGEMYKKAVVQIRYDDECGNGHNTFAITASFYRTQAQIIRNDPDMCGCCHSEIAEKFPELKHLIKWHGVTSDGPLGYIENTRYHANDRDYNGCRAGDPNMWDELLKFGDFPILIKAKKAFREFILNPELPKVYLSPVAVPYVKKQSSDYDYRPHYTLTGFDCQWHECPFDSLIEAENFSQAFAHYPVEEVKIPTGYSKGKAIELEAARNSAVWPDATLEQLQDEKLLLERLPALMQEFKNDMESLGFTY